MAYLLIAAIIAVLILASADRMKLRRLAALRPGAPVLAAGLLAGGLLLAVRGAWPLGAALVVIALGLTLAARWPRAVSERQMGVMSRRQACEMLGVGEYAGPDEIRAAYARLIQRVHPDKGGAPGLAVQLNLARDLLLKP